MAVSINWQAIDRAGLEAAVEGVDVGLERIESRAKELAPVRKVFGQYERPYLVSVKPIAMIRGDRALRRQLGLGPEDPYIEPPMLRLKNAPKHLRERRLGPSVDVYTGRTIRRRSFKDPGQYGNLDRRGRYEFKHQGRSAHNDSLGGRLRAEIHSVPAEVEGRLIRGRVVSPTPYAKYQELGTRHNPAHPYLRPAGHENRNRIRVDIGRRVASAARPLFRGRMEVVVHFRAR